MVIKCHGIPLNRFYLPPFEVNKGELVGINLYSGGHFYNLEKILVDYFSGRKKCSEIVVNENFTFVERFRESTFKRLFYPDTVQRYLKSKGRKESEWLSKIYEIDQHVQPITRVNELAGNPQKWLSLFATMSKSNFIMFDLTGQDPLGAEQTLDLVNEFLSLGGTAILFENCEDSRPRCSRFISIKILDAEA